MPVIYKIESKHKLELRYKDQSSMTLDSFSLDVNNSQKVFNRTGEIERIIIHIQETELR